MDRAKEFHGEVLKLRWMKRKEKGERRGEDSVGFGRLTYIVERGDGGNPAASDELEKYHVVSSVPA